jgi:peptidoglycan endopeptidase LytE
MKGRRCAAMFISLVISLFTPALVHGKITNSPSKLTGKPKEAFNNSSKAAHPDSAKAYKVHRGDSLYKIAKVYKTTPEELMAINGLHNDRLKIGQSLKVPAKEEVVAKVENPKKKAVPAAQVDPSLLASLIGEMDPTKVEEEDINQPLRVRLVEAGFKMLGVRYRFGGTGRSGIDCSGLVKNLFSKFNIDLPRSSREQFKQGEKVDRDKLEAGDLVFFSSGGKTPTHVGIYIGNDKFLHAARKAHQVVVSDLNKIWYTMRYLGARRIMDLWWEEPEPETEPAPEGE